MSNDIHAVATEIAKALDESRVGQVRKVVHVIGVDRASAVLEETRQVLASGGMKVKDGSRNRTPGGVWFHLVRCKASDDEQEKLFPRREWKKAVVERLTWEMAQKYVAAMRKQKQGEIDEMQLKVIGRPAGVAQTDSCMVIAVQGDAPPSTLPRGVPLPPSQGQTVVAFVSKEQWAKVVDELKKKTNAMRIHGYPVFNPEKATTILVAESIDVVKRRLKGNGNESK